MADDRESQSREDLTEEASQYRLEEFRSKGMVSQSKELSGLLVLLTVAVMMYSMAPRFGQEIAEFMKEVLRTDLSSRVDLGNTQVMGQYLMKALKMILLMGFPICGAGFLLGILASFAQVGAVFSFDPLTPDFSKIDPLSGLRRLFSLKQLFEGLRMILKVAVVLAVCYSLIKNSVLKVESYSQAEPLFILTQLGKNGKSVFLNLFGIMIAFAGIDFYFQREEYQKNLRLTKQEAKQEQKEREGDPLIRSRIRAVQREMARRRMMDAVKKATVIVTNPTHIAVALVYDNKSMSAPKVVAKGADLVAQKIKEVARQAGVPLVENVPLARTLFKTVKIGQVVPRSLYQAIAEVLVYVYRLKRGDL